MNRRVLVALSYDGDFCRLCKKEKRCGQRRTIGPEFRRRKSSDGTVLVDRERIRDERVRHLGRCEARCPKIVPRGRRRLAAADFACRAADLNGDEKDVVRQYNDEGRPKREEADRNFDGTIDEISEFDNGRIALQQWDTNGDGVIPKCSTKMETIEGGARCRGSQYKPNGSQIVGSIKNGRTVRIGVDADGDGKVDRWDRDAERLRNQSVLAQDDEPASSNQ
ncbi:MAG: hypothetical protein R3A47_06500 [Polyangiales bacterium]